jgi:predicted ester cyclase
MRQSCVPMDGLTWGRTARLFMVAAALVMCSCAHVGRDHKADVGLWYDAFNEKDPSRLDRILSREWVDEPSQAGQPAGPAGAKKVLLQLTNSFPDFRATVVEVLQDGDKVVVRSEITGTLRGPFMTLQGHGQRLHMMAIDIHQFEGARIVHTWHVEDWMTGLGQLGLLDRPRASPTEPSVTSTKEPTQ